MNNISPIILLIAVVLDIFGLMCLILTFTIGTEIGEALSFVPDVLGLILIGGSQMFMRRRQAFAQAKTARKAAISKAKKKGGLKFFGAFIGEILPFIGAFPFWTIYVLSTSSDEESVAKIA